MMFSLTSRLLPCRACARQSTVRLASNLHKNMKRDDRIDSEIVEFSSSKGDKRVRRTYVWGNTTTGALGEKLFLEVRNTRARTYVRNRPYQLKYFQNLHMEISRVASGHGFSLFAARDGRRKQGVYGTGVNTDSQLGYLELGRRQGRALDYVLEPTQIKLPVSPEVKVEHVACGRAHSVIVTNEGTFSLGNNAYGQCGRPIVEGEIYKASQIINKMDVPNNIQQVVCGLDHTVFLTADGELFACGLGADGQTAQAHCDVTDRVVRMRGLEGRKVVHVACMTDTVLAVTDRGEVYGCGNNEYEQLLTATEDLQADQFLPLPLEVGHVTRAAAGGTMCAVLNDRGEVHVWGYGILGAGPSVDQSSKPHKLPTPLFGKHEYNQESSVVDIQAGVAQYAAVTNHGELYTWGLNTHGMLGLGKHKSPQQYFPLKCNIPASVDRVSLGVDHMIAQCRAVV